MVPSSLREDAAPPARLAPPASTREAPPRVSDEAAAGSKAKPESDLLPSADLTADGAACEFTAEVAAFSFSLNLIYT